MSVDLKIKVTKDILEKTKNCSQQAVGFVGENCPIALSVRDILPNAYVGEFSICSSGIHSISDIMLPDEAKEFISIFDRLENDPVSRVNLPEIEFTISIPDEVIETINIEALRPLLTNHPTLELI